MSERTHKPSEPAARDPQAPEETQALPSGSSNPGDFLGTRRFDRIRQERAGAAASINRTLSAWGRVQRKAEPGAEDKGAKDEGAEVSQPGDAAEQEADKVADGVADKLHGDDKGAKKAAKGGAEGDASKGEEPEKSEGTAEEAESGEGDKKSGDGEALKEKAPEIGAKLDGVGRKIFLAPKNPAAASVKRMGKSGQDKAAIADALKNVQHERGTAVEDLTQLQKELPKFGLPRARLDSATRSVRTALNAINDHLTDADITGAMRDAAGDPVRQPGSGDEYDHLKEVTDALGSLKKTRIALTGIRGELAKRQTDPKILADKLDPALDSLSSVVQSVGQALKKIKKP